MNSNDGSLFVLILVLIALSAWLGALTNQRKWEYKLEHNITMQISSGFVQYSAVRRFPK